VIKRNGDGEQKDRRRRRIRKSAKTEQEWRRMNSVRGRRDGKGREGKKRNKEKE
jgi:hypothetical protein